MLQQDIASGRLDHEELQSNFAQASPPLAPMQAVVESERCFYCHDAPCIQACPTSIDIPRFINAIGNGNPGGAARIILEANILGGSCARVCPTEILCEQKCVHNLIENGRPVRIGALQEYATDWQMAQGRQPFTRAEPTGRRVAVVGAGPAGLACAHRLALHGHDVSIFDSHGHPGGLNQYGVAAYKMADDFAAREVAFLLSIGGIVFEGGKSLGIDFTLDTLRQDYDAVFLAFGLGKSRSVGIEGEDLPGVMDALAFIEQIRTQVLSDIPVGRRVIVIGGGNTAVDAAVQARRLGADSVTLAYRRGPEQMSATLAEREWAQTNGVSVRFWSSPVQIMHEDGVLSAVAFDHTPLGQHDQAPRREVIPADMVLTAVGQLMDPGMVSAMPVTMRNGRIVVDDQYRTSLPGVYAGGDCTEGMDLTVAAVRDGRDAAQAIHAAFGQDRE
ncbi:MAG: NAD(P)-dependent oxidoreductase [Acetobacter papayae]